MNIKVFLDAMQGRIEPVTLPCISFNNLKEIMHEIDDYYEALDSLNPHAYVVEMTMHPDDSGGVYLRNMRTEETELLFSFDEVK